MCTYVWLVQRVITLLAVEFIRKASSNTSFTTSNVITNNSVPARKRGSVNGLVSIDSLSNSDEVMFFYYLLLFAEHDPWFVWQSTWSNSGLSTLCLDIK